LGKLAKAAHTRPFQNYWCTTTINQWYCSYKGITDFCWVHQHLPIAAIFWMLQLRMRMSCLSHYDLLRLHTTKYQNDPKLKNCTKPDSISKTFNLQTFHKNTSPSHENLRRVSKSPLLHPFTCRRSCTLDWCVMSATSADSSRLFTLF
jgi:hypothetical protein